MEFLPLTIDDQPVYAGPVRRLGAYILDSVILLPGAWVSFRLAGSSLTPLFISWTLLFFVMTVAYWVGFAVALGATPGKLAFGTSITMPDGSRIGWSQAFKRYVVMIVLGLTSLAARLLPVFGIHQAGSAAVTSAQERAVLPAGQLDWSLFLAYVSEAWIVLDGLAIFFNSRRRALHDFIAGTVVVRKQFAQQARVPHDVSPENGV